MEKSLEEKIAEGKNFVLNYYSRSRQYNYEHSTISMATAFVAGIAGAESLNFFIGGYYILGTISGIAALLTGAVSIKAQKDFKNNHDNLCNRSIQLYDCYTEKVRICENYKDLNKQWKEAYNKLYDKMQNKSLNIMPKPNKGENKPN